MMSLNQAQRRITSEELKAHFHKSTLTEDDIAQATHMTVSEVRQVLAMNAPKSVFNHHLQTFILQVWDVRDVINANIKSNGMQPTAYSFLKGEKEDYWFLR